MLNWLYWQQVGPGPGCSSIRAHTHHPWVILVPGTSRHRFVSVFSSPAQQVVFPRFSPSLVHINKERYNNTPCSTRLGLRQGRSLWLTSFPYPHPVLVWLDMWPKVGAVMKFDVTLLSLQYNRTTDSLFPANCGPCSICPVGTREFHGKRIRTICNLN